MLNHIHGFYSLFDIKSPRKYNHHSLRMNTNPFEILLSIKHKSMPNFSKYSLIIELFNLFLIFLFL